MKYNVGSGEGWVVKARCGKQRRMCGEGEVWEAAKDGCEGKVEAS